MDYNSDDDDDNIRKPDEIRRERLIDNDSPYRYRHNQSPPIDSHIIEESILLASLGDYEKQEELIYKTSLVEYMTREEQNFETQQTKRSLLMKQLKDRLERLQRQHAAYLRFYEIIQEYTSGVSNEFKVTSEEYEKINDLLENLYTIPQKYNKLTAINEEAYNQCMSMIYYE